jgi:hypothetical protein
MRSGVIAVRPPPLSASAAPWSFLDWWSFLGTLATLIGLLLALAGLYVAIKQIQKTLNATKASVVTAVEVSRRQLISLLDRLTDTRTRIEQSAQSGNRAEMLSLLDTWMLLASELRGFIEQFELPVARSGTENIRSNLGLDKISDSKHDDSYNRLQTVLVGSISSAKRARPGVERIQDGADLATRTVAWRNSVMRVVNEAAQFRGQMNNYLREGPYAHGN